MYFEVSGVTVSPIIPFLVAFFVSLCGFLGRCIRCLPFIALSGERSGVYQSGRLTHESVL